MGRPRWRGLVNKCLVSGRPRRRSMSRMVLVIDLAQSRLEHVRINLRRRQVGVTEHGLDRAQIGAALEQMGRERMPQHVRAEMRAYAGLHAVALEQPPESAS